MALAGIALFAGNCTQQNPISAQSGGLHSTVGLLSLPAGEQVPSELETVTNPQNGESYIIVKGNGGEVFYKYKTPTGSWSSWQNTGFYAFNNIVTVACPGNSKYSAPSGVWVMFEGGPSSSEDLGIMCFSNNASPYDDALVNHNASSTGVNPSVSNGITLQLYVAEEMPNPLRSNIAAVMDSSGFPGVFCVRTRDTTLLYTSLYTNSCFDISTTRLGPYIAADTVSSGYGSSGHLEVFALDQSSNLLTMTQTSALYPWNPHAFPTTFDTIGSSNNGNPLTVAKNKDGHLEVFSLNGANYIIHNWQENATTWYGWSQMTSPLQSQSSYVSVGTNADGRLELFFPANYYGDGKAIMMHQWQTAVNVGPWSTPAPLSPNGTPVEKYPSELVGLAALPQCVGIIDSSGTFEEQVFGVSNLNATDSIYYIHQIPSDLGWTNWTMFN